MATDRVYGDFQTAGVKVATTAKSSVNSQGTDAYALLTGALGADGLTLASAANPIPVASASSTTFATGTTTQPAASVTAITVLAANANRRAAGIYYDGAAILYLIASATTPTSSVFTIKLGQGYFNYYEVPPGYTGIVRGIWSSAVGAADVTEFSA